MRSPCLPCQVKQASRRPYSTTVPSPPPTAPEAAVREDRRSKERQGHLSRPCCGRSTVLGLGCCVSRCHPPDHRLMYTCEASPRISAGRFHFSGDPLCSAREQGCRKPACLGDAPGPLSSWPRSRCRLTGTARIALQGCLEKVRPRPCEFRRLAQRPNAPISIRNRSANATNSGKTPVDSPRHRFAGAGARVEPGRGEGGLPPWFASLLTIDANKSSTRQR